MKIREVRAAAIDIAPNPKTNPRVPRLPDAPHFGGPMSRYPEYSRATWSPGDWKRTVCVVTADDGTWGMGMTLFSGPVVRVINDHLAKMLVGQDPMATEKLWDVMQRSTASYGTAGLASYAISAVDNALWDLKGKLLKRPVYE
ncbi:MAG: hypothetical protein HY678_00700, partial [Chloroflexi bacterium]|nr:hypothetical protein [Chloroflexota bacterium]